ncbi:MAG: hypothetical protein HYZ45_07140 [Burkholderiales bacterium]|nr:hypothetical protein [Burkholderiales bacterium]
MTFNINAAFINRTFSLLNKINIRLERQIPRDPSFWGGKAGIALYYACIAQSAAVTTDDSVKTQTIALQLASSALNEIAHAMPNEIIKQAWVLWSASTVDACLGQSENTAFCHDIEELLLETLADTKVWHAEYDVINGLLALGAHALAHPISPHNTQLLARVVTLLCSMSAQDGSHQWWPSTRQNGLPSRLAKFPNGYRDLGLAHGNAGVIVFFARLVQQSEHRELATTILHKLVPWQLAQRNSSEQIAAFPYLAETRDSESRCGWCYGDVGIAWALLQAGVALKEENWLRLAHQLARNAAARPPAAMGFTDHALCHGTLGVAHILRRIAVYFADVELQAAANQLMHQGLAALELLEEQLAQTENSPINPSYLEGWAGMGLALLAACTAAAENMTKATRATTNNLLQWDYPLLLG